MALDFVTAVNTSTFPLCSSGSKCSKSTGDFPLETEPQPTISENRFGKQIRTALALFKMGILFLFNSPPSKDSRAVYGIANKINSHHVQKNFKPTNKHTKYNKTKH